MLGMSSVFIGTVMMVARVFDAFNDPIMGIIVAKTKTRWGRFRPWIFAGTVLNAVTIYALYATPQSMDDSAQRIWLVIFYFAWGITYTLLDIPFWSMIPAITEPGNDREALTSLARTCAGIGDAIPTVLTMVIVPVLSASNVVSDYRIGFKWWALIVAVVFVISETVCVVSVPEKPIERVRKLQRLQKCLNLFSGMIQAMTVVMAVILVYTSINICGNLVLYFFQFDVGNEGAELHICGSSICSTGACYDDRTCVAQKIHKKSIIYIWIYYSDRGISAYTCYGLYKSLFTKDMVYFMHTGDNDLSWIWNAKCYHDNIFI